MNSVSRSKSMHEAWLLPSGTLFFMCGILLGRITDSLFPAMFLLPLWSRQIPRMRMKPM